VGAKMGYSTVNFGINQTNNKILFRVLCISQKMWVMLIDFGERLCDKGMKSIPIKCNEEAAEVGLYYEINKMLNKSSSIFILYTKAWIRNHMQNIYRVSIKSCTHFKM